MLLEVLKSKIHRVTVTQADLNYIGSITIDEELLEAANIIEGERVHIVNNNNGERFSTYVIKGERGSGTICLNGAAARKVQPGDIVIILCHDGRRRSPQVQTFCHFSRHTDQSPDTKIRETIVYSRFP